MSVFAKTEHRPAIRAAEGAPKSDGADLLYLVAEAGGLLIDERPGARRAVAVGLVVEDPAVGIQADELRGLAAHLEQGADRGTEDHCGAHDRLELVLGPKTEPGQDRAAGPGDPNADDGAARKPSDELLEERSCCADGVALEAAVMGEDKRQVGRALLQIGEAATENP